MTNFPNGDRNTQIIEPVTVFRTLNMQGNYAEIRGPKLPPSHWIHRHVQGVAIRGSRTIITENTVIATGQQDSNGEFIFHCDDSWSASKDGDSVHLGGIQTIGDWFVVGCSTNNGTLVQFYNLRNRATARGVPASHLTIKRREKAGSIGITDYEASNEGRYYLLAVSYKKKGIIDRNVIDFYRTEKSNLPLSNIQCKFEFVGTYDPKEDSQRNSWNPDKKWGRYVNAISLLAGDDGTVYFVGFNTIGLAGIGKDIADLYKVDVTKLMNGSDGALKKLGRFHLVCKNRTKFRWGASALVTSGKSVEISACARNVRGNGKNKHIRMNVFRNS